MAAALSTRCNIALPVSHRSVRAVRPFPLTVTQVRAQAPCKASQSHQGHAVLHDFCMTLPYSAALVVAGGATALFASTQLGLQLLAASAVVAVSSYLSLKSWKAGSSCMPQTLVSAAAAGYAAFLSWQRLSAGGQPLVWGAVAALSAAAALFCAYNVLAGGNPPPKAKAGQ